MFSQWNTAISKLLTAYRSVIWTIVNIRKCYLSVKSSLYSAHNKRDLFNMWSNILNNSQDRSSIAFQTEITKSSLIQKTTFNLSNLSNKKLDIAFGQKKRSIRNTFCLRDKWLKYELHKSNTSMFLALTNPVYKFTIVLQYSRPPLTWAAGLKINFELSVN